MVDMTKCSSTECPWRYKCYRFTVQVGERQSWANLHEICELTDMSMFVAER
jgi:hypothetical protein